MNIDLVQIFWLQIVIFATSPDIALSKWTIKIKVFIPKNVALSIKVDQRPNSNVEFSLLEQQRFFNVFLNHKAKTFEFSNGLFFMLMRCLFFLFTLIDSLRLLIQILLACKWNVRIRNLSSWCLVCLVKPLNIVMLIEYLLKLIKWREDMNASAPIQASRLEEPDVLMIVRTSQ